MDKSETRAVIKYLEKKKVWKASQIHKDMQDTIGDSAPTFTAVHKWVTEFKHHCESLEDDSYSGRLKTATTHEESSIKGL